MAVAYRQKIDWLKQEILALSDKLNSTSLDNSSNGNTNGNGARDRIIAVLKRYRYSSDGTQTLTSTLHLMELWASLLGELMQRTALRLSASPMVEVRPPLPTTLTDVTTNGALLPSLVVPGTSVSVGGIGGNDTPRTPRDDKTNGSNGNGNGEIRHPLASVQNCLPAVLGIINAYDIRLRKDSKNNGNNNNDEKETVSSSSTTSTTAGSTGGMSTPRAVPPPKKLRPLIPTPPTAPNPTSTATVATSATATSSELEAMRHENAELRERLNLLSVTLKGAPKASASSSSTNSVNGTSNNGSNGTGNGNGSVSGMSVGARVARRAAKVSIPMVDAVTQTDREVCDECPKRRIDLANANRSVAELKAEVKRLVESTNQLTDQISHLEEKLDGQADATQNFRVENQALKVHMAELERDKQKFDKLKITAEEFRSKNAVLTNDIERVTKLTNQQKDQIHELERCVLAHEATIEAKLSEVAQLHHSVQRLTDDNRMLSEDKGQLSRGHEQALIDNRRRWREIREQKEALESRVTLLESQLFKAQVDMSTRANDERASTTATREAHEREVDELKRQLMKNQSESQRSMMTELSSSTANVTRLTKELAVITHRADTLTRDNTLLVKQLESETKRAHDMAALLSGMQTTTKEAKDQSLMLQLSNDSLRHRAELLEKNLTEEQSSFGSQMKSKALMIQKLEEDLHAARKQITQLSAPANIQRPMQLKRMDSHSQLLREAKTPGGRAPSTDFLSDVVDRISSEMSANLLQKHIDEGRVQLKTLVEAANTVPLKENTGADRNDRSDYGSHAHKRGASRQL